MVIQWYYVVYDVVSHVVNDAVTQWHDVVAQWRDVVYDVASHVVADVVAQ